MYPNYSESSAIELVEVSDIGTPGAFDKAMRGIDGVIHVATIIPSSTLLNPEDVIPTVVQGAINALKAAQKEPTVKRFVFTSSCITQAIPLPGPPVSIDANTWNEAVVDAAYAPPPYTDSQSLFVYAASKVLSEKAVWKFVQDHKPRFTVNTILPSTT